MRSVTYSMGASLDGYIVGPYGKFDWTPPDEQVETGPLSKREAEVARLIAQGLSNREIAARLFISERTVTTHVGNTLNKLGFDSRVQIASWIGTSGL
jgi:DNA-binding NarL/FixJ family response regulator